LSWGKLKAFSDGDGEREEILERVLVWLMSSQAQGCWYNQFCPAAGLCGGNRTAVDIARADGVYGGGVLDFVELKEWNPKRADAEPLWAALKVFSYYCMVKKLTALGVDPYTKWTMPAVRLWFMAPTAYFANFGGRESVDQQLSIFAQALARLRDEEKAVGDVIFNPAAITLDPALDLHAFRSCFDWPLIGQMILSQRDAGDPGEVLLPNMLPALRGWARAAFYDAGLTVRTSEEL
jgi:hypothetical protein